MWLLVRGVTREWVCVGVWVCGVMQEFTGVQLARALRSHGLAAEMRRYRMTNKQLLEMFPALFELSPQSVRKGRAVVASMRLGTKVPQSQLDAAVRYQHIKETYAREAYRY